MALSLPEGFIWRDIDISDNNTLDALHRFLLNNYVEGCDMRFQYGKDLLTLALTPPGYKTQWYVAVFSGNVMVGFIAAIPILISIDSHHQQSAAINFLCVHKKLRNHRLAPVLIKELTRRINSEGVYTAIYTRAITANTFPTTSMSMTNTSILGHMATKQYWHRPINIKKLVNSGIINISEFGQYVTLSRAIKLYAIKDTIQLHKITPNDYQSAHELLSDHLKKFRMFNVFTINDFIHWFGENTHTYVIRDNTTTDFVSFYVLPSKVLTNNEIINTAYLHHCVATSNHYIAS